MFRSLYQSLIRGGEAIIVDKVVVSFRSTALTRIVLHTINREGLHEDHEHTLVDSEDIKISQILDLKKNISCLGFFYELDRESLIEVYAINFITNGTSSI